MSSDFGLSVLVLGSPHDDGEAPVALEQLPGFPAADGDGDDVLDVADIEPEPCQCGAIRGDLQDRQASHLLDADIRGPLDPVHHLLDGLSNTEQFVEIVAEHLDRDIGADARKQLVEPHLDGLGELVVVARNRSEEHTSELQSLMRISYAVFCLKKKKD